MSAFAVVLFAKCLLSNISMDNIIEEQVLNPQKGVSGPLSFKLIHTNVAPTVTSWRSESRNIDLVVLDKLLFGFPIL